MARYNIITEPTDSVYIYDGGLAGFFCAVHECVYAREMPHDIIAAHAEQPLLFAQKHIETDMAKAAKVRESIAAKISPRALELLENVYMSCLENKEMAMINFILYGYRIGGGVVRRLGDPLVNPLLRAEKHLVGENQLLLGFIRFADYDGYLAATITPKNFILPYLSSHFCRRFRNENFMIYDKTHKMALIYQDARAEIIPVNDIEFPNISETEARYQGLWKSFYNTIAIEARENPRCRMTHMPKRYWENMLEVRDLLQPKTKERLGGGFGQTKLLK